MLYLDKTHTTATINHCILELKLFCENEKKTLMYLRLLKTH